MLINDYCLLRTVYRLLFTAHGLLLKTCCLLLNAHCYSLNRCDILLSTHRLLSSCPARFYKKHRDARFYEYHLLQVTLSQVEWSGGVE